MSLCVPVMERVSLFFYGAFNLMSQHEKNKSNKQQEKIQKFHGRYEKIYVIGLKGQIREAH